LSAGLSAGRNARGEFSGDLLAVAAERRRRDGKSGSGDDQPVGSADGIMIRDIEVVVW
jgi:hypothetical protein